MSAIWNLTAYGHCSNSVRFPEKKPTKFAGTSFRVSWPFQDDAFHSSQLAQGHFNRATNGCGVRMALLDERLARSGDVFKSSEILAYDLVQGALVRWSSVMDRSLPDPPTAVFLHGILGSRKNWGTFARRLAQEFPTWQFLLVDLRCHGDSALRKKKGPHTVASTALDVLKLVRQLRITPRVLVGHSFGGKVVLSMVEQAAKPLARSVRVWVLDATPGKVRPGGDGEDHPAELISFLSALPMEISSKREIVAALVQEGFSKDVAQWVVTNLRPTSSPESPLSSFSWVFDLKGIAEMYRSYEETNLWKIVEDVPRGVHVNFLKAERSLHRWSLEDIQRIHAAEEIASEEGGGVEMHVLEDAGHWIGWNRLVPHLIMNARRNLESLSTRITQTASSEFFHHLFSVSKPEGTTCVSLGFGLENPKEKESEAVDVNLSAGSHVNKARGSFSRLGLEGEIVE